MLITHKKAYLRKWDDKVCPQLTANLGRKKAGGIIMPIRKLMMYIEKHTANPSTEKGSHEAPPTCDYYSPCVMLPFQPCAILLKKLKTNFFLLAKDSSCIMKIFAVAIIQKLIVMKLIILTNMLLRE